MFWRTEDGVRSETGANGHTSMSSSLRSASTLGEFRRADHAQALLCLAPHRPVSSQPSGKALGKWPGFPFFSSNGGRAGERRLETASGNALTPLPTAVPLLFPTWSAISAVTVSR
jgi:hypothetical protein